MTTLGRLISALTVALGLGSAEAVARPQQVSPEAAPAAWTAYAETATAILSGWLSSEDEAAVRVRAHLAAAAPDAETPPPPLVVKLWVAPDGAVTRTDVALLSDPVADADLRAVLGTRRLPPPPPDMLLPLRLALQVQPAPETATEP